MIDKLEKPTITLAFFSHYNFKEEGNTERLLSLMSEYIPDLTPDKIDYGKGWRKIDIDNMSPVKRQWENINTVLFRKENPFQVEMPIVLSETPTTPKIINLYVEESYFLDPNHTSRFVEFSMAVYNLIHPDFGLIHETEDKIAMATIHDPRYGKTIVPINMHRGMPGIYWGNFWGPSYVEKFGKGKLLSAPSFKTENLIDGGLMILTGPTPLNSRAPESVRTRKGLRDYLGDKYFYP